jgi:putative ATP-dependent endonuclease of the OLD family
LVRPPISAVAAAPHPARVRRSPRPPPTAMHYLESITVENFRSCTAAEFPLSPFTPLVGYNNGGKSNVLSAIRWLLRRSTLAQSDFCNPASPVSISGAITGVSDEVLDRLDERHRRRIEPLVVDNRLRIRRLQPSPGGAVSSIELWVFDPRQNDGEWIQNPTGIDGAIAALFPEPIEIGAMEDAAEDAAKFKTSTTIGKLIGELVSPLEDRYGSQIQQSLDEVKQLLEAEGDARAEELTEFDNGVNGLLDDLFRGLRVSVHVPPPEIAELFKSGTIRVFEGDDGPGRPISSMGHGAQRAIQMALIRYLAVRRQAGSRGSTTVLLIDEPELYLHPHAVSTVRRALRALSTAGYQVIFSTHSPQMVGIDYVAETLIIRKNDTGTYALPTLRAAVERTVSDAKHQAETIFEFQNAAQVLFADHVLIMEGKAEHKLMPLIGSVDGRVAIEDGSAALISIGGATNTAKALDVLQAMGLPGKALVDLDYAFRAGIKAGLIESDDSDVAICRDICRRLADEGRVELAPDGFPKNGSVGQAADGFALLAMVPEGEIAIGRLHERLKEVGIWLWKKGTLENHLGLDGKGPEHWSEFALELVEHGCRAAIDDWSSMKALLDWALAA